jgi:hypothetical protein
MMLSPELSRLPWFGAKRLPYQDFRQFLDVLRQHIEKFAIVSSHWLQGCE